jgi:hypothetical protein
VLGDAALALAAFALGVGVAELLGTANLGTALGVGQIAFVLALCWRLLRPDQRRSSPES